MDTSVVALPTHLDGDVRPPLSRQSTHSRAASGADGDSSRDGSAASSRRTSAGSGHEGDAHQPQQPAKSGASGFPPADGKNLSLGVPPTPPLPGLLAHQPHLRRVLSWVSLTSLGVGATIGAGIFVLTGTVAKNLAGPAMCLSFLLAAVVCFFCGLSYAEFASISPSAGSAYAYSRATMGQFIAWMVGWNLVLEYTIAAAAVAQSWSQYFNEFLDLLGARIPFNISNRTSTDAMMYIAHALRPS